MSNGGEIRHFLNAEVEHPSAACLRLILTRILPSITSTHLRVYTVYTWVYTDTTTGCCSCAGEEGASCTGGSFDRPRQDRRDVSKSAEICRESGLKMLRCVRRMSNSAAGERRRPLRPAWEPAWEIACTTTYVQTWTLQMDAYTTARDESCAGGTVK